VLQLSLIEGMEAADVGAVLGIPAGTVRSRLHTARKCLLDVMK
jgi:DNA-directed RNA polymerase specialized sigma24 family protein